MDQITVALPESHDLRIVLLSYIVAVIASYTALDLAGHVATARGRSRYSWLIGGTVALGLGIWSMHFTGMVAFMLPVPVTYNGPLVVASLLVAFAAAGYTLWVVGQAHVGLQRILVSAPILGAGIAAMHYIGMAAMQLPATLHYSAPLIVLSLLIAIGAAGAALWLATQFRTAHTGLQALLKGGSALVMGAAISGMHYTGMAAASFHTEYVMTNSAPAASTSTPIAITIGLATLLVLGLALLSGLVDRRFVAQTAEFESLFLQSPSAIYACTLEGTIRTANPAAAALHQRDAAALIGQPLATVLAHDTAQLQAHFEQAKRGMVQTWDCTLLQGDVALAMHLTALPIIVAGQIVGMYVMAEDITGRITAEAALRASEQQYRIMLRDLATPVIPITDAIVVLPIVGGLDLARTAQMETRLLHDLAQRRAQVVIIDLTGVPSIDAPVAHALLQMVQAVRLLGVDAMVTGLRAQVALTLVQLKITLTGLQIHPTLQEGISMAIANVEHASGGMASNVRLLGKTIK